MSTTSTRRLTFTTRSTAGMRTTMPGPLAPSRMRPRRENTAPPYSVTTIRIDLSRIKRITTTITITMNAAAPALLFVDVWARSMAPIRSGTEVPVDDHLADLTHRLALAHGRGPDEGERIVLRHPEP